MSYSLIWLPIYIKLYLIPMVQTYVLYPLARDLCPKQLSVSANHTLIDLLIYYALHVVQSYDWNCVVFAIQ